MPFHTPIIFRQGAGLTEQKHRRATIAALAIAMFLLLLLLVALNAFNLHFLRARSTLQIFAFTALSVIVFLLFVVLLVLLFRNTLKLLADQRSRVLGSRLRTRMFIGALLLSFAPALFMFLFSFLLLNRSIDRWFSQPVAELRESSTRIAFDLSHYAALNARAEAESLAHSETLTQAYQRDDAQSMFNEMRTHRITLQGGFSAIYRDATTLAQYEIPKPSGPATIVSWLDESDRITAPDSEPLTATILKAVQQSDEPILSISGKEYALGSTTLPNGGLLVVGLPMPAGLDTMLDQVRSGANQYWTLYRQRRSIRSTFFLLLLLLTVLTFFASSWLGLYLSKQITRPVEALADAMDEIAEGHYQQRVTVSATEELGELIRSFNHMAADLEQSRALAETSTQQLSAANLSLEARRNELEAILETIPSGVVTLDTERHILSFNRAFVDLIALDTHKILNGTKLDTILPPNISEEITRIERRARRMGVAASDFELRLPGRTLSLSATMAALDLGGNKRGSILVIEDVTEFLRAQRQVAWKEVAQRVAHEIRNPLTPIALSAERIKRHVNKNLPESPGIINKCGDVILTSVESMRRLVDQFAALAEFPAAQPKPTDLNTIVESSVALFHGRLDDVKIEQRLASDIPPVMADAEALKRALTNLIDNAAEAMQHSLLRVLSIETCLSESHGMAEIVLADTGHGLTDETRERLFLPYFSTKQRGTGLGLSIAAKIIQDHQGAIRAEKNSPAGARFIVELPLAENSHNGTNGHSSTFAVAKSNGSPS